MQIVRQTDNQLVSCKLDHIWIRCILMPFRRNFCFLVTFVLIVELHWISVRCMRVLARRSVFKTENGKNVWANIIHSIFYLVLWLLYTIYYYYNTFFKYKSEKKKQFKIWSFGVSREPKNCIWQDFLRLDFSLSFPFRRLSLFYLKLSLSLAVFIRN